MLIEIKHLPIGIVRCSQSFPQKMCKSVRQRSFEPAVGSCSFSVLAACSPYKSIACALNFILAHILFHSLCEKQGLIPTGRRKQDENRRRARPEAARNVDICRLPIFWSERLFLWESMTSYRIGGLANNFVHKKCEEMPRRCGFLLAQKIGANVFSC